VSRNQTRTVRGRIWPFEQLTAGVCDHRGNPVDVADDDRGHPIAKGRELLRSAGEQQERPHPGQFNAAKARTSVSPASCS
jgi:hypothetical protein